MAKNRVQFQKGLSFDAFMNRYGTEEACHAALFAWRWRSGFICPECGFTGHCRLQRGAPNKVSFVAAVAVSDAGQAIAMRLRRLNGFRLREIARWARRHLHHETHVVSDGLACFRAVGKAGCTHTPIVTGGGPASVELPDLLQANTMIGNVKKAIHGTYHALRHKHLPRYLAEFCYRFNRRYRLEEMVPRLANAALRTAPMPERLLKLAEPAW